MKTKLLIISLLISVNTIGQIKHYGNIKLGWKNGSETIHQDQLYNAKFKYPDKTFFADINLTFMWKFLKFEQIMENNFYYKTSTSFTPVDINFQSTLSFSYNNFSFGISHSCLHPVISQPEDVEYTWRRGSENRIFIKLEW